LASDTKEISSLKLSAIYLYFILTSFYYVSYVCIYFFNKNMFRLVHISELCCFSRKSSTFKSSKSRFFYNDSRSRIIFVQ